MKLKDILENEMPDSYSGLVQPEDFRAYIDAHHKDGNLPFELQDRIIDQDAIYPNLLQDIKNPTRAMQEYARKYGPYFWLKLNHIDKDILIKMLQSTDWAREHNESYIQFIKKVFADNQLLMNKWLRFAEAVKDEA